MHYCIKEEEVEYKFHKDYHVLFLKGDMVLHDVIMFWEWKYLRLFLLPWIQNHQSVRLTKYLKDEKYLY